MSTLSSMTGFARVSGGYDGWQWQWEARSVNGRNLDMRVKLPPSYNYIEQDIKKILSKHFTRGNFQISLSLSKEDEDLHTHVNEPLFEQLVDIIKKKNGNNNYIFKNHALMKAKPCRLYLSRPLVSLKRLSSRLRVLSLTKPLA